MEQGTDGGETGTDDAKCGLERGPDHKRIVVGREVVILQMTEGEVGYRAPDPGNDDNGSGQEDQQDDQLVLP